MTARWAVTVDCADAPGLARFWALALGYAPAPPPQGWDTWESWLREFAVPEEEWNDGASIVDPDGVLPPLCFLRVPEGKTAKNRLHLDVRASGGRQVEAATRTRRIRETVARLTAAGAAVLREDWHRGAIDHVVMTDPEGNEFCVV